MKVLFISPEFPPLGSPAAYQNARIAKALFQHGAEITIVSNTGLSKRSNLHLNESQQSSIKSELITYRTRSRSPIAAKVLRLVRPYDTNLEQSELLRAASAAIGHSQFDALFSMADPFVSHYVSSKIARLHNFRFRCYWFSDPIPVSFSEYSYDYMRFGWRRKICQSIVRKVINNSECIVTVTGEILRGIFSLEPSKIRNGLVVPHTFDPDDWMTASPPRMSSERKVTIAHSGALYWKRTPFALIDGIARFNQSSNLKAELVLEGGVEPGISQKIGALSRDLTFIKLRSPVSFAESRNTISKADIVTVIDVDIPVNIHLPSKVADYVAAMKPVLYVGKRVSPTVAAMQGYPLFAQGNSPEEISAAINKLILDSSKVSAEDFKPSRDRFSLRNAYQELFARMNTFSK